MLTATDVEQKTFSTALRGYDLDEVDDFLDEVVATIRDLNEQLEVAKGAQPPPAVAPVPEPERPEPVVEAPPSIDESAIGRALVAAQTAADQLLDEARAQADQIVEGARGEADTLEAEKEARKAAAESEIAALAARVASIRSELSVLAGEVSEKLDEMDAVIEEGKTEDVPVSGGMGMHEAPDQDGDSASGADVEEAGTGEAGEVAQDEETETGTTNGTDHLDEILTGVATDLQLETDQPSEDEDSEGGDEPDGSEESEGSEHQDDSAQSTVEDDEESGL